MTNVHSETLLSWVVYLCVCNSSTRSRGKRFKESLDYMNPNSMETTKN